ncbi:MAG: hypothetical protein KDA84_23930, partial [Planctomycetaceae bacterium]|nr:hypothetical protein [Planctomycetaceae bacterium]
GGSSPSGPTDVQTPLLHRFATTGYFVTICLLTGVLQSICSLCPWEMGQIQLDSHFYVVDGDRWSLQWNRRLIIGDALVRSSPIPGSREDCLCLEELAQWNRNFQPIFKLESLLYIAYHRTDVGVSIREKRLFLSVMKEEPIRDLFLGDRQ